ncbi:unnamed protein product, partial [Polarella glacialis]
DLDEEQVQAHSLPTPQSSSSSTAWAEAPYADWAVASDDTRISAGGVSSASGRQPVPQRGRQPSARPREAAAPSPSKPSSGDSSCGPQGIQADVAWERAQASGLPPHHAHQTPQQLQGQHLQQKPLMQQPTHHQQHQQLHQQLYTPSNAYVPDDSGVHMNDIHPSGFRSVPKVPAHSAGAVPVSSDSRGTGDLLQQDNRYLHNSLTSEVFERSGVRGSSASIVDVGVEDLNDLAHMEVAEEVRQWEDRIVSQHMVALQEDARLLTKESELLSQVQQGASYDIDWYVSEVDKVVRRKMEVYMSFMEDLEAFKAQLRREETLSRSCQRSRDGLGGGESRYAQGIPAASSVSSHALQSSLHSTSGVPRALARDGGIPLDVNPQRTPRTPRLVSGMAGSAFGMESR